jgi:hypothetical protein
MPLQPAFLAYLPTDDLNCTGNYTTVQIGSITALTEVYDQNADFNVNGIFTAPVTGRYNLSGNCQTMTPVGGGVNTGYFIYTSNRIYYGSLLPSRNTCVGFLGPNFYITSNCTTLADMEAGDTAHTDIAGNGGAKTDDIIGTASCSTFFSGELSC